MLVLDASTLAMGQHLPPADMLPQLIPSTALTVPGYDIPLFQNVEELLTAYRNLPNYLLHYYELVMEQIEEVQRAYQQEVDFMMLHQSPTYTLNRQNGESCVATTNLQ